MIQSFQRLLRWVHFQRRSAHRSGSVLHAYLQAQGRFEVEARKLNRDRLLDTDAWGKHLFYHWKSGRIVHVHLGLYGKFRRYKSPRLSLVEPYACALLVTRKPLT